MNFNYPVTVTANTTQSAPVKQDLKLSRGVIRHVGIYFPDTAEHTVYVQMRHYDSQIFPANPDGYYRADNIEIAFPDEVDNLRPPHTLRVVAWNTGQADVVIFVNVTVIPPEAPTKIAD